MKTGIRFPALNGGQQQSYTSNDIENFKGEEIFDNLVREIVQNSLDAPKKGLNEPVKVEFRMEYIEKSSYPVFKEYEECLKGCRKFWGDADKKLTNFLNGADALIKQKNIPTLVASDYNTTGLCGSRDTKNKKAPWQALINEDGVSSKEYEASGGSYGIGKNAPFACSDLSFVFYNTFAEDGEKAFEGVARLATLYNSNDKATQRIGKFQKYDEDKEIYEPVYEKDNCSLRDLFKRDEKGTDVIIVGFNQEENWETNVKKAVFKNFFVAVKERKLIVIVKGKNGQYTIDDKKLPGIVSELENDKSMSSTIQLYNAFCNPDKFVKLTICKDDDAELYIKADSSYGRTIANFRNTGMLVGRKIRRILQHYAAVFVVRGTYLGELLQETEPPRHNTWDYKRIKGEEKKVRRKEAKSAIDKIDNLVLNELKNQFEIKAKDSVDAEGVGEYLPDEVDEMSENTVGDDILKPKIKIGKMRVENTSKTTNEEIWQRNTGETTGHEGIFEVEADPDIKSGTGKNKGKGPRPVNRENYQSSLFDENGNSEGVTKKKGASRVRIPVIKNQRVFPMNIDQGIYKIVLIPAETYNKVFFSCRALGEDGHTDMLSIAKAKVDGKCININKNVVGPIVLTKDNKSEIYITFDDKEKMTLELSMSEE